MCGSDTKVSASVPVQQIQEQRHGRCGAPGPASRSAPASWRRKPLNSEDIPQSENSCPANRRSLWLGSRAADPGSCILFITLKLATLAAPIHSASWGPFFLISFLLLQEVALAEQPSRRSWSCIIFVTRKLATLAVDAVLRAAPGLGFLTAAPFMGYGGDTSAASMDVNVRLKFTVEDFLRKIRRYLGAGVSDGGPSYGLRRRHIRRVNGRQGVFRIQLIMPDECTASGLGLRTAAPFMGYSGDTFAASMDVKVCIEFRNDELS